MILLSDPAAANTKDQRTLAMTLKVGLLAFTLLCAAGVNAAPEVTDYAQGVEIFSYEGRPLVEVLVPDFVYQTATRDDLGDVRVFNAEGTAVPHAFCASPATVQPVIMNASLPVFDLQAAAPSGGNGATVEVETSAGTQVRVQEESATPSTSGETQTWAHVIDARSVSGMLRSIEFDWTSPDGASQAGVRIEASEDLDQWRSVVPSTTLLRVARDSQQLQRKVIPLPLQTYQYLRVVRADGGPSLQLAAVIAEVMQQPQSVEPVWFNANPVTSDDAGELLFDAARIAPVTYARLVLPHDNASVRVKLQSRADAKAAWRDRWSGEFYSIVTESERRTSPPAEIDGDHDRYWRVVYSDASQALTRAPSLELGYRPAKVRFLAQGASPYTLAFGSRRAEPAPIQQCGSLLAGVSEKDLSQMIGEGSVGTPHTLGGETAFKPLPQKTPVRLFVLWGVLITGVGVLVAMAFALLKRVRHQTDADRG